MRFHITILIPYLLSELSGDFSTEVKDDPIIDLYRIKSLIKNKEYVFQTNLVISGSSCCEEVQVDNLKDTGLIFARYSSDYGKISKSRNTPGEIGYSLDIPKDMLIVRALLDDEDVKDALINRNLKAIEKAIYSLNNRIKLPILITDYLQKALEYQVIKH